MEARAIQFFTLFATLTLLYRASDGEYFTELDDVQAYVAHNLEGGAYTIINRTTPLPPAPTPLEENVPIWVYVAQPAIAGGLRYDGVVSSSSDTLNLLGNRTHTTNMIGAFRVNNHIIASVRSGPNVGMQKFGRIVAIANNVLTINFTSFQGTENATAADWDILLSGVQGLTGNQGVPGPAGPSGSAFPGIAGTTTSDVWFRLNYRLDEMHAASNGNHLYIYAYGFAGPLHMPFRFEGIFIQEDGVWNFLRCTRSGNSQYALTYAFQVNNIGEVFFRVGSPVNDLRVVCKAFVENGLADNKMTDVLLSTTITQPANIVGTELLNPVIL